MNKLFCTGAKVILLIILSVNLGMVNAQVVINEVCSYNGNTIEDEDGEESDWIELYNSGNLIINLEDFSISDKIGNKWVFPPVSLSPLTHLLLFASGKDRVTGELHTNFKLSKEDDAVRLFDPSGNLIDQVNIPSLHLNHSFGRIPDGTPSAGIIVDATPGSSNPFSPLYYYYESSPEFSIKAGFHSGAVSLQLSGAAQIRYTTDGSDPVASSALYSGPLSINQTTVVKARAFPVQPTVLPSAIITNTYLVNYQSELPVFSISTHPDNLWDWNTGIYVNGPNASPNYPYYGANFWQNWEIEATIEFFETSGKRELSQNAGVEIHGGTSNRSQPMKSLRLSAKNKYGEAKFRHRMFEKKNIDEFKNIVLRNSSFDFNKTHFRDGTLHDLMIGKTNIDLEAYRPSVVFLNGEYFGVHNIREKVSKYYPAENYEVNADEIDLLEEDTIVLAGSFDNFNNMHTFITGNNMDVEANFSKARNMIDVESICDYYIAETYLSNIDWPYNNMKFWREQKVGAKWRYILVDLDISLGNNGWAPASFDVLGRIMGSYGDTSRHVQIFRSLLQNQNFREYYINRYADLVNTLFSTQNMQQHIIATRENLYNEMPRHFLKWGNDMAGWDQEIFGVVMPYIEERPAYAMQQVKDVFGLNAINEIELDVWPPMAGDIRINTITPGPLPWKGNYFDGNPVTVTVLPNDGFTFVRWVTEGLKIEDDHSPQAKFNPDAPARVIAYFSTSDDDDALMIYPNPSRTTSTLGFIAENSGSLSIHLCDAAGRIILELPETVAQSGLNQFTIELTHLPKGLYFVYLNTAGKTKRSKLLVG